MSEKLRDELEEIIIDGDTNTWPLIMKRASENEGKYQPVTIVSPKTKTVFGSFFVRVYREKGTRFIQLQEFSSKQLEESFIQQPAMKSAEIIEHVGFRMKIKENSDLPF